MELYDAFEQAVTSTAEIVKGVRADQRPTPCTEWDVRALLNHIVGTLWLSEALFADHAPRHPMLPGDLPATDLVGDDPAAAYAEAATEALAVAGAGDTLTRMHKTPLGDMPGPVLAGFTTLDVVVHGWDLARATGRPVAFDDALVGHVLGFAERAITEDTRAPRIGPAIAVPEGAPLIDRLVAFVGRRP